MQNFESFQQFCQAQQHLNSTQFQLKLRLRLALFPPDPPTRPPGHPPTRDSRLHTTLLHDYSRLIQGCFNATKKLLCLNTTPRQYQNFFKSYQESFNTNQSPPPSWKKTLIESFKTISNVEIISRLILEYFKTK